MPPPQPPPREQQQVSLLSQLEALGLPSSGTTDEHPPIIDLRGGAVTLNAPLVVRQPCTIRNGTLQLGPSSVNITVAASRVKIQDVVFGGLDAGRAVTQFLAAAIVVSKNCCNVEMSRCSVYFDNYITMRDTTKVYVPPSGILVEPGAEAALSDVEVRGAPGCGILVLGEARLSGCHVQSCGHAAQIPWLLGVITAADKGHITMSTSCTAIDNAAHGFLARGGGYLQAAAGCVAQDNERSGFRAEDEGSKLIALEGCVSTGSKQECGFVSISGGYLTAGANCRATGNKITGFEADGEGSKLIALDGCVSTGNKNRGFAATCKGHLEAGPRCEAKSNLIDGFFAQGQGSKLEVGQGACSEGHVHGFRALFGGHLTAGANCRSAGNTSGFEANASGSLIEIGRNCVAEDNRDCGFTVRYGGRLVTGEDCHARGNRYSGFTVTGEGSTLEAGSGCLSEGIKQSWLALLGQHGYMACDKGYMSLGANCEVRNNGGGKNVPKFLVDTTGSTISRPEGVTLGGWPRR